MINIKEMEKKALEELQQSREKLVKEMLKVCEEGIYSQLKEDLAVNQKISKDFYEITIPFNVKNSSGFETNRIPSNGLTPKEIMEKVAEALQNEGYTTEVVENNIGEKSDLRIRLNINEVR